MRKNSPIGGQAVLEGVMMRRPERMAVAVRTEAGTIAVEAKETPQPATKPWWRRTPFVRGVVNFVDMMKVGIEAINRSASLIGVEEESTAFEEWLSKKTGKSVMDVASGFAMVLGMVLAVGLFFLLPTALSGLLTKVVQNAFAMNVIEGVMRMIIFLGYLFAVTLMPDIKRFFGYHGAEHKVVNCYEHDLPLTVANAQSFTTRHPRCGTSFLFLVMVVSILIFALAGWSGPWYVRMPIRLALLPVVAAVSYEALMGLAKWENAFTRAVRAPGMWFQALTTREPDDGMVEVAIAAFAACLTAEERARVVPAPAAEETTDPAQLEESVDVEAATPAINEPTGELAQPVLP